jgi:nucleoside-diphosphate-sugar epimerase
MAVFYKRVFGKEPQQEDYAAEGSWVDVRDVARGHVRSLQVPEAGGKRFLLTAEEFVWQDWCECLLSSSVSLDAHRYGSVDVVNELHVPGLDVQVGQPGAGKSFQYKIWFSNHRAKSLLGLQFRDKVSTARDIIEDFKSRGWV